MASLWQCIKLAAGGKACLGSTWKGRQQAQFPSCHHVQHLPFIFLPVILKFCCNVLYKTNIQRKKTNLWLLLNFLVMRTRQQWLVSPIAFPPRKYPSSLWLSRKGRNYSFSSSSLSPPRRSFISQLRGNLLQNPTCIKIVEFVSLKALAKTGWNQWKTPLMLTTELWTGGWINKDLPQAGSLIVSYYTDSKLLTSFSKSMQKQRTNFRNWYQSNIHSFNRYK